MNETAISKLEIISSAELLKHWQGHRKLTRQLIERFPENELFSYSIGGMRTFALLAHELIGLSGPGIKGIVTGDWTASPEMDHFGGNLTNETKADLLRIWDEVTALLDAYWPQISAERFHDQVVAFGQYENSVISTILYFIDNEIHHRGQGYVYLRSLGIEPPAFWDRPF
ncbi:damage-inducible protein DinB [Pedobacter sp. HMF7647]|uniref:Damage-inducible protein DinB n=1 Tax=Hufsiella arboris TaxID=2695275 RepID=A0A7K1YFT7_9SPHI|nr:DinB family protein [Hufsiella arboris]MXV52988.1 damage-inducible protein DinB [Hufsiella arboris]